MLAESVIEKLVGSVLKSGHVISKLVIEKPNQFGRPSCEGEGAVNVTEKSVPSTNSGLPLLFTTEKLEAEPPIVNEDVTVTVTEASG